MTTTLRYLAFVVLLLAGCTQSRPAVENAAVPRENVRFGMPSPATADPNNHDAYLIERQQYVVSYNDRKHIPNWVSWHLRKGDIGHSPRTSFEPDTLLPSGFYKVTTRDYNGSGFDRGHMCPHSDRSSNAVDSKATFYLSNILPQSPHNNQKAWERLESYCRELAERGNDVYIQCGPLGVGGTGRNGYREKVGNAAIVVPAKLWKVIVVLPDGTAPCIGTRVIAVLTPNDQTPGPDWTPYRTSVAAIEQATGYHFLQNIPAEIVDALRQRVDDAPVHIKPKW